MAHRPRPRVDPADEDRRRRRGAARAERHARDDPRRRRGGRGRDDARRPGGSADARRRLHRHDARYVSRWRRESPLPASRPGTMTRMRRSWAQHARDVIFYLGLMPPGRHWWRHLPRFVRDGRAYRDAADADPSFPFAWSNAQPMLADFSAAAGSAGGHYFHQDLWAARRIHEARPAAHVDIGSRIDGFVAHVLTFMPVTVVDIRSLDSRVAGLSFVQGDICRLEGFADGSIASLSCLHAIEHIGLGRYGDPILPDGWRRALAECSRVLAPGGRFYLGTPIGRERLHFNSGRVFLPQTIIAAMPALRLASFSAVDDAGYLVEPADPAAFAN